MAAWIMLRASLALNTRNPDGRSPPLARRHRHLLALPALGRVGRRLPGVERPPYTHLVDLQRKLRCTHCGNGEGNSSVRAGHPGPKRYADSRVSCPQSAAPCDALP